MDQKALAYAEGKFTELQPHEHPAGFEWANGAGEGMHEACGYEHRENYGVLGGSTFISLYVATPQARLDLWPYKYFLDVTIGDQWEFVFVETYQDLLRVLGEFQPVMLLAVQTHIYDMATAFYDDFVEKQPRNPRSGSRRTKAELAQEARAEENQLAAQRSKFDEHAIRVQMSRS